MNKTVKYDFEKVYDAYDKKVFYYLLKILKNEKDAEDVHQDTFLKIYNNLDSFRGDCRLTYWIFRIAKNTALNYITKNRRISKSEVNKLDEEFYFNLKDEKSKSVEQIVEEVEIEGIILDEINSLGDKHKSILVLKEIYERSYEEISKTLEISMGTVMSRLYYARQKLKEKLIKYL